MAAASGGRRPARVLATGDELPAVAAAVVDRLDCAVLAMRYPVVDEFAIELAGSFYELLLGKGQPVARALALSLVRPAGSPAVPGAAVSALSVGTPALFGARAADLTLVPPAGEPQTLDTRAGKLAGFPDQPVRFVGRVGALTRAVEGAGAGVAAARVWCCTGWRGRGRRRARWSWPTPTSSRSPLHGLVRRAAGGIGRGGDPAGVGVVRAGVGAAAAGSAVGASGGQPASSCRRSCRS